VIAPAASDAIARWLDHQAALKDISAKTRTAYQTDLSRFVAFQQSHVGGPMGLGPLTRLTISDMRAWMAAERSRGVSARSLARALSAVKGFVGWLAEREGFDATAVLSTRAPKFKTPLPRPLAEDAAVAMIGRIDVLASEDWVAKRDVAVVTLLYGCGLRISEALSLTGADMPLGETLRMVGKGGKERVVPVIARLSLRLPICSDPGRSDLSRGARRPVEPENDPEGDGAGPASTRASCDGNAACAQAQFRHPSAQCRW